MVKHPETGNDRLNARDDVKGNDGIQGGSARDSCAADREDTVEGCP